MKTLIINAHPSFNNKESFANQMQERFLKKYKDTFPNDTPDILNLYDIALPRIETTQLLNVWNKQYAGETMTAEEQHLAQITAELLAQFKAHQRIVIISPLHNFNITSRLKDYIDNILIARHTFKYTSEGSVGLMTDNYKALYIQASGSIYTNDDRYQHLDFAPRYLKAMFKEMMAFDEFYTVRAQGTARLSKEAVLEHAQQDLNEVFKAFYN
ncbi:FMN-dependent NADH-azoreductase [Staphylococcus intermedius]|uniref:FMN dependent NADH:quinone oxidoreductase n=1 Tax=Staphylococcus intermedius NCTC 11048 TaxID=1141106 RepID=A0A380G2A5_STAIN|nr:NAD(P)H-dependent oxidoreductase [Staphylococcus intermedius]PCF64358.1 FMN-dependent NADH-azoreductase [Staphylococcus intermedius]PCF79074.1 FMN-dependent NADH-azoreductase [Staphylococcus intermedius]PCF80047.1 FMN-dependent NADH-azoreductase [Staphylococcus intermedius]PCF89292.1 FMN-dependent NADH-azoreductase [Staphylococcus intermedius]PNZ49396.1 FMN-dependent NADH-azoreductase [Staphylococcus intermedius NCTC 11048]